MKISEIQPGMMGVRLTAKIKNIGPIRDVKTKDGRETKVASAVISDGSGEAQLTLWAEQIEKVKSGDTVKIVDGMTKEWQGQLQISVGRRGQLLINPEE